MIGIYCITNTLSGKQYIGQSRDIKARWRHHQHLLKSGQHPNKHLQRAWSKHGGDCFVFSIIETFDVDIFLSERERYWIAMLDTYVHGYNRTQGGEGQSGRSLTDEQKRHLSEINMGKRNPNYGLKRSAETRQRMSDAMRGKPHAPRSEEAKRKTSEKLRGRKKPWFNKRVLWLETGQEFESIKAASRATGFTHPSISAVCRGVRESLYKQHFAFVD